MRVITYLAGAKSRSRMVIPGFLLVLFSVFPVRTERFVYDPETCRLSFTDSLQGVYDLSGLSKLKKVSQWQTSELNDGNDEERKVEVEVLLCGSFSDDSPSCRGSSASTVCLTTANYSSFPSKPLSVADSLQDAEVALEDKALIITYTSSSVCNKKCAKNYSSQIGLYCSEDKEELSLNIEECTVFITWKTKAACVLNETAAEEASCYINVNKHWYNFSSLGKESGYAVRKGNQSYIINICNPVREQQCHRAAAICSLKPTTISLSTIKFFHLFHNSENGFFLVYKNFKGSGVTKIILECSQGNLSPTIELLVEKENLRLFKMKTSLACPPAAVNCSVSAEKGYRYQLESVAEQSYHRVKGAGIEYLFSICHPLHSLPQYSFSGGSIYAVLVNKSSGVITLGTQHSSPVITKQNEISFQYEGGTPCGSQNHSLNVQLICSRAAGQPEVDKSSDQCHHNISWHTPAACPHLYEEGEECRLKDVNLTPLYKESAYKVESDIGTFLINICGPLNKSEDVGVVWTYSRGKSISVGRSLSKPEMWDGDIVFRTHGEPCSAHARNSTTILHMVCDYSATEGKLRFLSKSDCQFSFVWKTRAACPKEHQSLCTLKEKNAEYDLTPLTLYNDNYRVIISDNETLYFNICWNIIRRSWVTCSSYSGACLVDSSVTDPKQRFKSVGDIQLSDALELSEGSLTLIHRSTELCKQDNKLEFYTFLVRLHCDPSDSVKNPEYDPVDSNKCSYHVTWRTRAACPRAKETTASTAIVPYIPRETVGKHTPCSREQPRAALPDLIGQVWKDTDSGFIVSVCKQLNSSRCPPKTGACREVSGAHVSLGLVNDLLFYNGNLFYLNYTGPGCMATLVSFTCLRSDHKTLDIVDNCTYLVYWPHSIACSKQVTIHNDNPLCELRGEYNITVGNNDIVTMSLCGSVESMTLCPEGSAVCLSKKNMYSPSSVILSLGFAGEKPQYDVFGNVTIHYSHGDLCNKYGDQYSTTVMFMCDHSVGKGQPEFFLSEKCNFQFLWKTSVICSVKDSKATHNIEENCTKLNMINCTLSKLHKTYQVTNQFNRVVYIINFNKETTEDNCGANICKNEISKWEPLAQFSSAKYFEHNKTILLQYKGLSQHFDFGDYCGAEIYMKCNHSVKGGHPAVKWEDECFMRALWETDLACSKEDREPASSGGHFWKVFMWTFAVATMIILVISIFICKRRHESWNQCCFRHKRNIRNTVSCTVLGKSSKSSSMMSLDEETAIFENPSALHKL